MVTSPIHTITKTTLTACGIEAGVPIQGIQRILNAPQYVAPQLSPPQSPNYSPAPPPSPQYQQAPQQQAPQYQAPVPVPYVPVSPQKDPKNTPQIPQLNQAGFRDSGGAPYSALLYDPSYLHTECDTRGRYYVAMPDLYGKAWLLMMKGNGGSDIYDHHALGDSNDIVDAANGLDSSDECNPLPNAWPDDSHPRAVMFSSQLRARQAWFETLQEIYDAVGADLNRAAFYCPPRMPNFNPGIKGARYGTPGYRYWDPDAYDWRGDDTQMGVCTTAGRWNFSDGATVVLVAKNARRSDCTMLGAVNFYFQDLDTKDQWVITAVCDTITRTGYTTAFVNMSLHARLVAECRKAKFNWFVALAEAIAATIKGIISIIIGIVTLNIGLITAGIGVIVGGWYNFAESQKALDEAKKKLNAGQGDGNVIVEEVKKIANGDVILHTDKGDILGTDYQQPGGGGKGPLPPMSRKPNLAPLLLAAGGAALVLSR